MNKFLSILICILFVPLFIYGQDTDIFTYDPSHPIPEHADTTISSALQEAIADTMLQNYNKAFKPQIQAIDTSKNINYWRITERTGEIIAGKPDTATTGFSNRQLVEGQSIAMSYLGNLGLPSESRIFFERQDRSNFMFIDPFSIYTNSPNTFNYINTKIPYSNILYTSAGSGQNKEEHFKGGLSINFGKKLNVGFLADYLYARGYYNSQSAKHLDWVFFGSYIADKHQLHMFINPADYTNAENGGITNDKYITHPEDLDERTIQTNQIPVNITNVWNHWKGTKYYLTYRYNLGIERDSEKKDDEGNPIKQFIPVSSFIYTFDLDQKRRNFYSHDSTSTSLADSIYKKIYLNNTPLLNDSTSYWKLRNTIGVSLREGFSSWAKFDLTAFLSQDFRNYTLMSTTNINEEKQQQATYVGGEIAKRTGKIFRYDAQGDFCVLGKDNIGDFRVSGNVETRIPIFKDTASIIGSGSIKNIEPSFYEMSYRSRYFWWDNDFDKIRKVYLGGEINIPHTKTNFKLGVENLTNYIYFDSQSLPQQHSGSIQILAATLQQNMRLGALHWNNQAVYQTSSNQDIIPLPDLCLYSSLFLQFNVAKVLTIQLGGDVHYFTKYYASSYEPATQQFKLQHDTKVGNYPLVNAFINCHLKYTRFFVEFYNISDSFISNPEYFSLPHYPVNPQIFKFGLSWDFHN